MSHKLGTVGPEGFRVEIGVQSPVKLPVTLKRKRSHTIHIHGANGQEHVLTGQLAQVYEANQKAIADTGDRAKKASEKRRSIVEGAASDGERSLLEVTRQRVINARATASNARTDASRKHDPEEKESDYTRAREADKLRRDALRQRESLLAQISKRDKVAKQLSAEHLAGYEDPKARNEGSLAHRAYAGNTVRARMALEEGRSNVHARENAARQAGEADANKDIESRLIDTASDAFLQGQYDGAKRMAELHQQAQGGGTHFFLPGSEGSVVEQASYRDTSRGRRESDTKEV